MVAPQTPSDIIHASCVALEGRGLLIRGSSGSGKSGLALKLMAYGAKLVSDDRVKLTLEDGQVLAEAPPAISGLIEARGIGLLNATPVQVAPIVLVVDLDKVETERFPPLRKTDLFGKTVTLLHKVDMPHFPEAILQYLIAGRRS